MQLVCAVRKALSAWLAILVVLMVLGKEQQEAATAFGAWKYLGNIIVALVLMLPTFDEHHQFRNKKQKIESY